MKDWVYKIILTILVVAIAWLMIDTLGVSDDIKSLAGLGVKSFL